MVGPLRAEFSQAGDDDAEVRLPTALFLIALFGPAIGQQWEAVVLGPGSAPNTLLVEIRGVAEDDGSCPDACDTQYAAVNWQMSPCAAVSGGIYVNDSNCAAEDSMCGESLAWLSVPFAWQVEIQEDVTYTIQGTFNWIGYDSLDHMGYCDWDGSTCTTTCAMDPGELVLSPAVPASPSGWSTLKSRYIGS